MSDPAQARAAILSILEPAVADHAPVDDIITTHQMDRLVAYSQAVSMRRIADLLEVARVDDGTETVITLPQILLRMALALEGGPLREVLTDATNNLANTLAEHRMYSK